MNQNNEKLGTVVFYCEADLNRDFARRAYNGTSYSPERRGDTEVQYYMDHMAAVDEEFAQWVTDDNREQMLADLEYYRRKYLDLKTKYLATHGRMVSQFITGAGGWTGAMVRRQEKIHDVAHRRMGEYIKHTEEGLRRLRQKYNPVLAARRPINSGDADALERLEAKLASLERNQELMKKCNQVIRTANKVGTGHDELVYMLMDLGLSWANAQEVLKPDYMGRTGFASFSLTNNSANIRRIKDRIKEVEAKQQQVTTEAQIAPGVEVVHNQEENRLQVFFPDKPEPEMRKVLKYHGFKWAPSYGCWQRQLTNNAIWAFRNFVLPEIKKAYPEVEVEGEQ